MLEFLRKQLEQLLEQRAGLKSSLDAVLTAPTAESRGLSDEEKKTFDAAEVALRAHDDQIEAARAQIEQLEAIEKRSAAADKIAAELGQGGEQRSPARTGAEPATYRKGGNASYFLDLAHAQVRGSRDAIDRLVRNDRETLDAVRHAAPGSFEARALTTTDGAIGEFVPPLWLIEQFVKLARAGRVVADQVQHMDLPSGTDSINLPRLASGTAVAEQATQNTAVQNTDAASNSVTANVATIAGQQVVSLQLLEQSPLPTLDQILLADLAADYATKLDLFVINNNATGKIGILNVSGLNAVTYTDATPTVGELYPKIADGIQQIHTGRFLPPQKAFMHPRRWAWFTASVDTATRPLVVPLANMPQNVLATLDAVNSEGLVGSIQGLPVFVDPSIPTNLGAGTNEDRVVIARTDDIILMEGSPRAESFREPLAAQLSVLLRFYNYAALHASRYPKSISVIAGTGLVAPTF
jgi:HK97 family phage major capsid protein